MPWLVFAQWPDQTALTQAMIVVVAVLSLLNVVLLLWLAYYVGRKLLSRREAAPRSPWPGWSSSPSWTGCWWSGSGIPATYYGIGWQNSTSMVFMIVMYALAAAIYFGFSAYRRRQGIDVNKVYKEIPVE